MNKLGFDNQRYIQMQSENILKRIEMFKEKLYLEFGGKLFDDFHATRVLPGFEPDSKLKMLLRLKDVCEMMIVINANHIDQNKMRGDLGITYDQDLMRLIDAFKLVGLEVGSVVITHFSGQRKAMILRKKLEENDISVAYNYYIDNYPTDIENICSSNGFGKNEHIITKKPLVVVTAPGPGSGKLAVCLSQMYHDYNIGINSGYAKFETFPIWNLSLDHPVNVAYEAATLDLDDQNMIDYFHKKAYGVETVNYNRDLESFPILNVLLEKIMGYSVYQSPTDMGVNMVGYCIIDDNICRQAACQEIVRRYYDSLLGLRLDYVTQKQVDKILKIINKLNIDVNLRKSVGACLKKAELSGNAACAIELENGDVVTGKNTSLLGSASAALLNALKSLSGIDDSIPLISPDLIIPIQDLKTLKLGGNNPRLHVDEVLIILAISALNNEFAKKAYASLPLLKGSQMHSSVILNSVDVNTIKKLGISLTMSPIYHTKKLYHKK